MKDNMKQRIAQVFSERLQEKPLEQITVKELTETLGVSRQIFYYYFHDIYEIIEWIFATESEKHPTEVPDRAFKQRNGLAQQDGGVSYREVPAKETYRPRSTSENIAEESRGNRNL